MTRLLGQGANQNISVFERTFNRSMGCWASADARTIWMSSQSQLWRFENALSAGESHQGYDALYVPRIAYTTGDVQQDRFEPIAFCPGYMRGLTFVGDYALVTSSSQSVT